MDKHLTARMFSAHSRTARWHAFLSLLRSTPFSSDKLTLCLSLVISDREVFGHSCSTVTHLHFVLLRLAHKEHHTHFLLERKDVPRCCATIAHHVVRQYISAPVHHLDVGGQSGYNARIARPTSYEPNVGPDENGTFFLCPLQTAMMKI